MRDLLADLGLLLREQRTHAGGGFAAGAGLLEIADEALDLGEREADRLELHDPVDAIDRLRTIKAEPTFGPGARLEQAELLVEMHRTNGLADRLRELSDPH